MNTNRYKDPDYMKKYRKKWYAKNRAHVIAKVAKWQKEHPVKAKRNRALYKQRHRQELRTKGAEWRRNNPSYFQTYYQQNKDELRHAQKRWRKKNRDATREYRKKWFADHREEVIAASKKWRMDNIDAVRERDKKYYKKNRDLIKARSAKWAIEHHARRLELSRQWAQSNPERRRAWCRDHYKKLPWEVKKHWQFWSNFKRSIFIHDILAKWRMASRRCYICGGYLRKQEIAVDHVHPRKHGGTHGKNNLMPVHRSCNSKKGARLSYPVARPDLVAVCCG